MTIAEMKQNIARLEEETRALTEKRDLEGAKNKLKELNEAREFLKIEEELAKEEERDLNNQKKPSAKESEFRTIVKSLMGESLTEEERANIKTTDNAAVVPKQFVNKLQEIKKGFGSLKEFCDVIPVTKNEGTIPVVDLDQNDLPEVSEGDNIVDGTLVTNDLTYKCKKHGLIQSLTSELIDDAEIEIENLIEKNFAEIVNVAENTKIVNVIKTNATAVEEATGYETIENVIDTAVPAVKAGLITLTNTNGFAYLKNKKDADGRLLNLVTEVNGRFYFNNKELVVADDALISPSELKKQIFYVLSMKEAVKFIDRKAVTLARSTEAGFRDDTTKIRILERFDVIKGSTRSIKKIEF